MHKIDSVDLDHLQLRLPIKKCNQHRTTLEI